MNIENKYKEHVLSNLTPKDDFKELSAKLDFNTPKNKNMKKKGIIICCVILAIVILGACLYVGIGSKNIEGKMWDYLEQENYSKTDIQSIKVKHSFTNILLSYNEWIIEVVFEDEPTSVYKYTLRDGSIVESGVSGTTEKDDLSH